MITSLAVCVKGVLVNATAKRKGRSKVFKLKDTEDMVLKCWNSDLSELMRSCNET